MANRIKEEFPEIEVDFYYMDIQHFGKSFPRFWETVSRKVNFIRSNPISIKVDAHGKPIVRFESPDEPGCREATYDLVSLSHGMSPAEGSVELADMIGVDTNPDGFYREAAAGSGIFVAGACKRPMRIEDSVEDATGISEKILQHLGKRPS
jgi:heterodisulfide reductase subunit A-like polyferredoxin